MQLGTIVIERSYHIATVKQVVLKKNQKTNQTTKTKTKLSDCYIIKSVTIKQQSTGILEENKN